MQARLDRLIELAAEPNIALHVVTLLSGYHAAAAGSFSILRFAAPEFPDVRDIQRGRGDGGRHHVPANSASTAGGIDNQDSVTLATTVMRFNTVNNCSPALSVTGCTG